MISVLIFYMFIIFYFCGLYILVFACFFFFFQAEDGIRDLIVTGVQTCALPISGRRTRTAGWRRSPAPPRRAAPRARPPARPPRTPLPRPGSARRLAESVRAEIGRASCRERV